MLVEGVGPAILIQETRLCHQAQESQQPLRPLVKEQVGSTRCSGCKQQKLTVDVSEREFVGEISRITGKNADLAQKQAETKGACCGMGGQKQTRGNSLKVGMLGSPSNLGQLVSLIKLCIQQRAQPQGLASATCLTSAQGSQGPAYSPKVK